MSLHKQKQNKTSFFRGKLFSQLTALSVLVGITASAFSFISPSFGGIKAFAACPAGTYANPGGNTFGADPYGGENCLAMTPAAAANIGNSATPPCNGSGGTVTIGTAVTCVFPLTGGTNNMYTLPNGGLSGSINTATGTAGTCRILDNGTAQAALICVNIPSTGATAGTQNIMIGTTTTGTGSFNVAKGSVILGAGGVACSPTEPCFLKTAQYDFLPKSSVSTYGDNDVTLTVKPNLFTTNAASGNKYVCRVSLKTEGVSDADANLGYAAQTRRIADSSGSLTAIPVAGTGIDSYKQFDYGANGCVLKLTKDQQVLAKWYFRIIMAEVNSSNVVINSKVYQGEPAYFLLYGAIGSIGTSVTAIN